MLRAGCGQPGRPGSGGRPGRGGRRAGRGDLQRGGPAVRAGRVQPGRHAEAVAGAAPPGGCPQHQCARAGMGCCRPRAHKHVAHNVQAGVGSHAPSLRLWAALPVSIPGCSRSGQDCMQARPQPSPAAPSRCLATPAIPPRRASRCCCTAYPRRGRRALGKMQLQQPASLQPARPSTGQAGSV